MASARGTNPRRRGHDGRRSAVIGRRDHAEVTPSRAISSVTIVAGDRLPA
jgi:hypothetical protein